MQQAQDAHGGAAASAPAWWRRLAGSTSFRLAALAFVVYQLNLREISSADTFPTRYLPISILTEGNLDLDEFSFLLDQPYSTPGDTTSRLPYFLQYRRGHYMSTYPVMAAILVTPLYAVPVWLGLTGDPSAPHRPGGHTRTEIVGTLLSKLAASFSIAISVALVYLALRRLTDAGGARWITLAYAFATSSWAVSSQGLWQTSISTTLLAGAFLALLAAEGSRTRAMVVLSGALVALAVTCRPPAVIFAVLLTLYVLRVHRRHVLAFVPIPAVLAVLLVAYNLYYFGTLNGGYEGYSGDHSLSWAQLSTALPGLLVSPSRGLLVFSPVVLPAFAGVVIAFRRRLALLEYLGIGVLLTVAFYSTFSQWHGAFSYSYRYLVDLLPALALLAAPVWSWLAARRWRLWTMGVLAAFSVGIQVVGVVYYPCGWYRSTLRDPSAMARYFDWRNLEVVQCFQAGPVDPDGLRALRSRLSRDRTR